MNIFGFLQQLQRRLSPGFPPADRSPAHINKRLKKSSQKWTAHSCISLKTACSPFMSKTKKKVYRGIFCFIWIKNSWTRTKMCINTNILISCWKCLWQNCQINVLRAKIWLFLFVKKLFKSKDQLGALNWDNKLCN